MTHSLHATFADPPREFGIMPFWFWNDDLDEAELVRQIRAFHDKGFGGFVLHARIGLSRRVGYLTDEYFRLARVAVDEASRLGMKVVLYDEGSYPSGSAQGRVVAENPDYAARCLIALQNQITGPERGFWHPNPGRDLSDELVCVVLGREAGPGVLDPDSMILLDIQEPELVHYDVPDGNWRLIALWNVHTGGTIRGVFAEEEDLHATAPAAGDLLNPDAVASFLRHTHEHYYAHLKEHFGETVVAMFTDEPMVLGRNPQRGHNPWPFTSGFLDELQTHWDEDVRRWLPALWLDCGPRTAEFRQVYTRAVYERLERVFYGAQSRWCSEHGIALTGHPAESNDFGSLRQFQWPGQDMVWRWVTPGAESALAGPHSCAPKTASSAAVLQDSRRNASEALGAYGWRLTLDEAKWLLDWHMVRGNNLFYLHACFYSIRGRRAFESEPDIGIYNSWWPCFQLLGNYMRRVCWLLTDGREVCDVAILTDPNNAAWTAAKLLYQNQFDFIYIDHEALAQAKIEDGRLCIGAQHFQAVVCDPPGTPDSEILAAFAAAGGLVLADWQPDTLIDALVAQIGRDVDWPDAPDLRVLRYDKEQRHFYLFVNEGEHVIEDDITLASIGALECWDALDGTTQPWPAMAVNGRTHTHLRLERRQSLILAVDPRGQPASDLALPSHPGEVLFDISGPWQVYDDNGNPLDLACPGDWAHMPGWETYAGRLRFETTFALTPEQAQQPLFLDLGRVGDIAEVLLNGTPIGVRAWAPYVWAIGAHCRAGDNQLEVRVINSMANCLEGLQRPSGLLGPVSIRQAIYSDNNFAKA
ncbi:MAG TPA: glycosyl hydrolase [Roseiflexaceae bacterium]|nr:glycosyl hydrolase [Roseiflexaceae bacterium]